MVWPDNSSVDVRLAGEEGAGLAAPVVGDGIAEEDDAVDAGSGWAQGGIVCGVTGEVGELDQLGTGRGRGWGLLGHEGRTRERRGG